MAFPEVAERDERSLSQSLAKGKLFHMSDVGLMVLGNICRGLIEIKIGFPITVYLTLHSFS